jgi:hypothetical protein
MICAKCGDEMRMTEKDTSSGRDIREYACDGCGHTDWEVQGPALWQILSDDRKEFEAAQADRALAAGSGARRERSQTGRAGIRSLWNRLLASFGKSR